MRMNRPTVLLAALVVTACSNHTLEEASDEATPVAARKSALVTADSGTSSPSAFVDACTLPDHIEAVFQPYGGIWEGDEGVTIPLPLPFAFTYFGRSYARYWVTSNGELGFGNVAGGPAFGRTQCPLADAQITAPIVFAYASDFLSSRVCMATIGSAPERKLVVTWTDAHLYELEGTGNGTSDFRFGVTLSESTNAIDMAIDRAEIWTPFWPSESVVMGAWATVGLQSGAASRSFSCQSPLAPPGSRFHHQP